MRLDTSGSASALSGTVSTVVSLAIAIFYLVAMWRIYTKAGQPGWACIIPIYGTIVLLRICGRPAWWFLLYLIPVVNVVIGIIVLFDLAKSFGKGAGFGLGLLFLSLIFIPILAFGGAEYVGAGGQRERVGAVAGN